MAVQNTPYILIETQKLWSLILKSFNPINPNLVICIFVSKFDVKANSKKET